jgi:hypothetical protein
MPRRIVPIPRSRLVATLLGATFVLPFVVILILHSLDVRIGQGYFAYRWTPVRALRTTRALAIIPIAGLACGAVWMLASAGGRSTRPLRGVGLLVVAMIAAGVWILWAPPSPLTQQMFNLTSPSSDGAFLIEGGGNVSSPREYLRDFPRRLQSSVDDLGGTRVLSNPPGMTILAYAVVDGLHPEPSEIERALLEREGLTEENLSLAVATIRLGVTLCAIWMASGFAAYGLGRVFLSSAGSAVFAIIVTFNPCTVHFVPGKDPGQLLTINVMLWMWFAGWKRSSSLLCAIAGAVLVVGSTFGLIHIWIAIVTLLATMWESRSTDLRVFLVRCIAPALAGAIAVVLLAWIAIGWNMPLTLLAVARRWGEIQKTFNMNRPVWYVIGLPIFLLFLPSGLWLLIALAAWRRRLHFGTRLALTTLAVMLLIYFAMGVTYELPRLWVAFLPPLTLGLAIDFPLLRGRGEHRRVAAVLTLIVLVQIVFTAFHWTFFDAREAEYRLSSNRFYH